MEKDMETLIAALDKVNDIAAAVRRRGTLMLGLPRLDDRAIRSAARLFDRELLVQDAERWCQSCVIETAPIEAFGLNGLRVPRPATLRHAVGPVPGDPQWEFPVC